MLIIHNTTYTYSNYIENDRQTWQRFVEEITHLQINVQSGPYQQTLNFFKASSIWDQFNEL